MAINHRFNRSLLARMEFLVCRFIAPKPMAQQRGRGLRDARPALLTPRLYFWRKLLVQPRFGHHILLFASARHDYLPSTSNVADASFPSPSPTRTAIVRLPLGNVCAASTGTMEIRFPLPRIACHSLLNVAPSYAIRSEEHTSELQSLRHLVC